MIHYHGGPITPTATAVAVWARRHAFVSFAHQKQMALAAELCQSFALDNGAFTVWKRGGSVSLEGYAEFVRAWYKHPGFDFALIPDEIAGDERANDALIERWQAIGLPGAPVWHLHESVSRLKRLCGEHTRVALGSSGEFAKVGTKLWWGRMIDAMNEITDEQGAAPCKLHGLRMLNHRVFSRLPLASADATTVARNVGIDKKWKGTFLPVSKLARGLVLADRIEAYNSAPYWRKT